MDTERELEFMRIAIAESEKSIPEDSRPHPKVGVVVVKDGKIIAQAHRGEVLKAHAEFIALEEKLQETIVAGATVYTTLEPCTTRSHPKVPCARRLVDRRVGKVVMGMLDPNAQVSGRGQRMLRDGGVETALFPKELAAQVEDINREWRRSHEVPSAVQEQKIREQFIKMNLERPLDVWYRNLNIVFWNRNFYRDSMALFTHLVEVVGGLSLLASAKHKENIVPDQFVSKAVAWWMTLCGKLRVRSVSDMLWAKFPFVCPYCRKIPHETFECTEQKSTNRGPDWVSLKTIGQASAAKRPLGLGAWQQMFSAIYPVQQVEDYEKSFARLCEELGELAESIRIFPASPRYFLSEAADVFAWLMHIQNLIDYKKGVKKADSGKALQLAFCSAYPDMCIVCGNEICNCPPILETTVGRIAHQVPTAVGELEADEAFMPSDSAFTAFQTKL